MGIIFCVTRDVKMTHLLAAPCQDDASFGRFMCMFCVARVVKMTHLSAAPCQDDAPFGRLMCMFCVTRVVKMTHLSAAPCQDDASFGRFVCMFCVTRVDSKRYNICDPLWEKVHFRAKCNIELCVKIAESGPLAVKLDYDTGENYSLSSTLSLWSDVRAPLLALTASSQRRNVRSERTCTVRMNNRMCGANTITIRVTKETLSIMASRTYTVMTECSACTTRASTLARRSGGPI